MTDRVKWPSQARLSRVLFMMAFSSTGRGKRAGAPRARNPPLGVRVLSVFRPRSRLFPRQAEAFCAFPGHSAGTGVRAEGVGGTSSDTPNLKVGGFRREEKREERLNQVHKMR